MAWYVDGVFCVMQHDVCYGMILYDMVNGKVYTVPVVSTAQGGGGSFKKRKTIGEIGCCESRMSKQKH